MNHSQLVMPDPFPKRIRYVLDNNRVAVLKRGDRDVLQLLYHFTFLSNYQIVYFLEYLYGENPATTKKKYQRFRERGLLLSRPYGTKWGSAYKIYYYLSKRGFMLLKKYGMLDSKEEYSSSFRRIGGAGSKDHFFAIRDAVLLTLLELGRIEFNEEEESFREQIELINPRKNPDPYLISNHHISNIEIFPDWIIKIPAPTLDESLLGIPNLYKDEFLNFEVDSGTETEEQIKSKIKQYMTLARMRPNENHHVLFSIIDKSQPFLKYDTEVKDKRIRIGNIKNYVIDCFAEYKPYHKNLSIYVSSIGKAGKIAKRIILEEYQNKSNMSFMLISAINKVKQSSNNIFNFREIDKSTIYTGNVKVDEYAELVLEFFIYGYKRIIIFKFMEEGNVRDYDLLDYHNTMMKNSLFRQNVDYVIGVYQTRDELISDILDPNWKHVQFISIDSIKASKNIKDISVIKFKEQILKYEERFEEVHIL